MTNGEGFSAKWLVIGAIAGLVASGPQPSARAEDKLTKEDSVEVQAALTDLKNAMSRLEKAVDALSDRSSRKTKEKISAELKENTSKLEKQINRLQKDIEGNTQNLVQDVQEGLSNVFGELSRVLGKASDRLKPEEKKN